jgi:hypothetical protein
MFVPRGVIAARWNEKTPWGVNSVAFLFLR